MATSDDIFGEAISQGDIDNARELERGFESGANWYEKAYGKHTDCDEDCKGCNICRYRYFDAINYLETMFWVMEQFASPRFPSVMLFDEPNVSHVCKKKCKCKSEDTHVDVKDVKTDQSSKYIVATMSVTEKYKCNFKDFNLKCNLLGKEGSLIDTHNSKVWNYVKANVDGGEDEEEIPFIEIYREKGSDGMEKEKMTTHFVNEKYKNGHTFNVDNVIFSQQTITLSIDYLS